MKKLFAVFLFVFGICFFANAQEDEDLQDLVLPSLDDDDFLEELQESNDIIDSENEKIAQEEESERERERQANQRIEKERRENKYVGYIGAGLNAPFNLSTISETLNKNSFPLGITATIFACGQYFAVKGNLNWDFAKYSENTSMIFSGSISPGLSFLHNDYWFVGLFGTFFFDNIEKYSYNSYGASGTVAYNFFNRLGIFFNCDATYRSSGKWKGKGNTAPYSPRFLKSWRICPSIGISYNFFRN